MTTTFSNLFSSVPSLYSLYLVHFAVKRIGWVMFHCHNISILLILHIYYSYVTMNVVFYCFCDFYCYDNLCALRIKCSVKVWFMTAKDLNIIGLIVL